MALSKPETTVEISNEDDGLEGICKSQSLYASILYSFRECHDLCVSSKLFSEEIILCIDQCAVNFRQLSMDTVTVAKRVSNQWLNTTILFYRNIDSVKDPKKILLLLSGQARDLAKCFKVIAQWATKLCSKFHKAQNDTIEEAEEFKKKFTAAESQAESAKKIAEDELDSAKSLYSGAKETADKWKTAQVATSWIPIGFIVTSIGSSVAERKRLEASKLERQASERLHEAEEELKKRKSEKDKAEFIANKAKDLVGYLKNLEKVSELVAAFWSSKADDFESKAGEMSENQVHTIDVMKEAVSQDGIEFWTKAKDEMDRYASAMSVINNSFNFLTEAKPDKEKPFHMSHLNLTLSVPSFVDID